MPRLDPRARVRRHLEQVLAAGPATVDDLLAALLDDGLELGPEPGERLDDVLLDMPGLEWVRIDVEDHPLADEAVVYDELAMVDGTTWTVPIGPVDLATESLTPEALALLFVPLLDEWCELDGGGFVDVDLDIRRPDTDAAASIAGTPGEPGTGITFPPGWLGAHGAMVGGWLQLRVEDGVLHAAPVDVAPEPTPAQVAALTRVVEAGPVGRSHPLGAVLAQVFVLHPELRHLPVPTVVDWAAAAGFDLRGSRLAPVGFDFAQERAADQVDDQIEGIGLGEADAARFRTLASAWFAWIADERVEPELLEAAAKALGSLPVLAGFVEETCDEGEPERLDRLVAFGEALIEAGRGTEQAGAAWLVARALAVLGRTDRFEDWVDVALGFDADHPLALYDQAWFAFDRGEARRAQALLRRFGVEAAGHDLAILDEVLAPVRPAAGRNDPCPCGSGRKYKQCHLGKDEVPIDVRLTWLYRKANWWLGERHRRQVEAMAWVRGRHLPLPPDRLLAIEPLIADAVLCEGGRFAQWLHERRSLLPDDEALLAAQWALVDRSVFEIIDLRVDEGLTLRDVRTGDRLDVQERLATHDLRVGWYVLARPLPTGTGGHQLFGGIAVVPDARLAAFMALLDDEPTPVELLDLVASLDAPPSLTTTDGEDTVFCETTWSVADPVAAAAVLDDRFGAADPPGRWTWLAGEDDAGGAVDDEADEVLPVGRTVLASLELDGDALVAHTHSEERAAAIAAVVAEHLPEAELVEDLRSDVDDLRADLAYEREVFGDDDELDVELDDDELDDDDGPAGPLDPADLPSEMAAVVRAQMDRYEEQWVDEPVPALGGATPREALDDPTRRDDLFRLLDRMDEQDERLPPDQRDLGMRPDRLRELLGLPPRKGGGSLRLPGR